jgi:hypothetical protein
MGRTQVLGHVASTSRCREDVIKRQCQRVSDLGAALDGNAAQVAAHPEALQDRRAHPQDLGCCTSASNLAHRLLASLATAAI